MTAVPKPRRWRQWTLRSRLVVAMVVIAGIGLFAANLVASTLVRSYLNERLDADLLQSAHRASTWNRDGAEEGKRPPPIFDLGEFPNFTRYNSAGELVRSFGAEVISFEQAKSHAGGDPFTVQDKTGTAYRVKVERDAQTGSYGVASIRSERVEATADKVLLIGFGVSGIVLLGIALAASAVVKIGLRPLTRMEAAAASIAADTPPGPSPEPLAGGRVPDADPHTESGRLGLALNTMLGRIEAALSARTASEQKLRQFLADASHELRTPLTSIRGFAELYRRSGRLEETQLAEMMGRIEQEAARMGLLVEDLLLLAALDEERPLRAQHVDLLAVAADTIRDAHVRNPLRFVALTSFNPVTVVGDDHRLRQVVTNLVSNALRHTGEPAKIEVRLSEETVAGPDPAVVASVGTTFAPGTRVAVVTVSDTGSGVPAEVAPLIFERLYRVDSGRARSQGGSGLGLSIVAAIVGAHGGRVELTPTPGGGATFRVLLPAADVPDFAEPTADDLAVEGEESEEPALSRR